MDCAHDSVLHAPPLDISARDGVQIVIDPGGPNWLATDARGAEILGQFDGRRTVGQIAAEYARLHDLEPVKAWQHVDTIVRDALRYELLTAKPRHGPAYTGRQEHLPLERLTELWIHTNNSCNLACSHCLVSSGPDGDRGLSGERLLALIGESRGLGVQRFYFTGGEPFLRKDIQALIDAVLSGPPTPVGGDVGAPQTLSLRPTPRPGGRGSETDLAILTNGLLFTSERLSALKPYDPQRLRLQISLDGSSAATNDPIRGAGSFERIVSGIRAAVAAGLNVTVSTAITAANADDVPQVTRLVATLGVRSHHLLWLHQRGRVVALGRDSTPAVEKVIAVVRAAQRVGAELGVTIDNCRAVKHRINSFPQVKRDLSNACVTSLCVYSDGTVYPSAAMANVPALACGSVHQQTLRDIWLNSDVCRQFRAVSVEHKAICRTCPLKFLCGGGDLEHAYFYGGALRAHDPYCELHKAMIADAFAELAAERQRFVSNGRSGFNAPLAFTGMGEASITCATHEVPPAVMTSRSECVSSFDLDAPRQLVRAFYGQAAEAPQEELCCPVKPNPEDLAHIPREVIERFYGCGSPIDAADIQPGETTLDLGSGAGIDVFIAAKKVGPAGRAFGVDMTDRMLAVARDARATVARNLGYDAVEFRKGFLEEIPLADHSVDLVTSNCVINLSPDKRRVFAEIWRVLRDHGRVVVADIVADEEVPPYQRQDPRLWGECISGALTEEAFLAYLEQAGFYGVQVLRKSFWKEVEGHRFHSITVRGYKFEKQEGCVYLGQQAIYLGPFKGVSDEEGHWFPRDVPVQVCTDTAAKLARPPYASMFVITAPGSSSPPDFACCGTGSCC
jgi:radical SAM protein with 4Fe4S-binding SPASM domain